MWLYGKVNQSEENLYVGIYFMLLYVAFWHIHAFDIHDEVLCYAWAFLILSQVILLDRILPIVGILITLCTWKSKYKNKVWQE